jgi:hypothetical protein
MAKKKRKQGGEADLKSEDIVDSLAEDVGADEAEPEEPVVPDEVDASSKGEDEAEQTAADESPGAARSSGPTAFVAWPVESDHGSVTRMLTGSANAPQVDIEDEGALGRQGLSGFLLLLLLAAMGVGIWQLQLVSSPEALASKRAERERMEEEHLKKQLDQQKKYGLLRIESVPPQAVVIKDGEKIVTTSEETGQEITGMTPMNIMNLDISQPYKLKLEKPGWEPFEFGVGEHLWTKDSVTGEYKLFKMVEMTPINCEYWFLYDAKKKRELKFDDKTACLEHHDDAVAKQVSVTECTCKIKPMEEEEAK